MIFDVLVLVVAVAVIALVARRADKRVDEAVKRMEAQTLEREKMIDKQAKVFVRKLEASRRAGAKALDTSRALQDDTRQLHEVMNEFMGHPELRRFLGR